MKRFRMKAFLLLTLLLTAFILPGCGGDAGNGHWDKPEDSIGLVSVVVTPATATIPTDGFQQFTATATYEDGSSVDVTTSSVWSSSTPGVATISPTTGVAEGITAGSGVVITATFGGMTATTTSLLTVTSATLTSIVVTPASAIIAVNGKQQFIATANYSDASTLDVTEAPGTVWAAANVPLGGAAVASLSANGVPGAGSATGVVVGTAEITATYRTQSGTATLDVTNLVVTIIPGDVCPVDESPTIPTVTMSDPSAGNLSTTTSTMGVANNGKLITATFSLAMDPTTIASATAPLTFTIKETLSGDSVAGTVTMDVTNTIATFTTSDALKPGFQYTASITTDAMSAGIPPTALACPYEWNFTTVFPAATGLAPINPGMLASYGIASAGGLTNSGATTINGDVVLNPNFFCNNVAVGEANDFGLCGGTPPINNAGDLVMTQTYPDTTTADQVMAALLVKWGNISPAQTPGATVLGCGTIGTTGEAGAGIGCDANATLPPGAYISATNSTIVVDGQLTLDGQGNPDAVFIFQAPSALTMAVNSQIVLIGGAKASNVWWYVGSDATLNGGTISQGNILASSAISMGTLATSCGRLLSGAEGGGAFTFLNNTVSVPGHPFAPTGCE